LSNFRSFSAGAIDADFMTLPPEVLATAMRTHQKYFSCLQPDGALAPRFLFVANNLAADGGKTIVDGNERVLRARLSDARFFWDQDRRVPLESRVGALAERVFHAKLAGLRDKVARMERLAEFLIQYVPAPIPNGRCAQCGSPKADLSTGMVAEFPELQGIMGRYYALHDGEHPAVADAIAEHYRPLGPNDSCPTAPDSIVVALADKVDSLVAFFAIGEKPTGSRDPFALRRTALGIIRLILDNQLRLSLGDIFLKSASNFDRSLVNRCGTPGDSLAFIAGRLEVHMRAQGVRHDLINAVYSVLVDGLPEDDLVRLMARAMHSRIFSAPMTVPICWSPTVGLKYRSHRIGWLEERRNQSGVTAPGRGEDAYRPARRSRRARASCARTRRFRTGDDCLVDAARAG